MRVSITVLCGAVLGIVACSASDDAAPSRAGTALADAKAQEICEGLLPGAELSFDSALTCPGCAAHDLERAADADFDTQATFDYAASPAGAAGSFRVRATTPGVSHGPGFAGVFISKPQTVSGADLSLLHISVIVKTYLGGVLQEASASEEPYVSNSGDGTLFQLRGLAATKPYDAIEVEYTWQNAREPMRVRLGEFCAASRVFESPPEPPPRHPVPQPDAAPASADDPQQIDVLLLYTPRFARGLGGDGAARDEAQRLLALANDYFVNSDIAVRYAVAGVEPYGGVSETLPTNAALAVLLSDPAVRARRDALRADVTALLLARTLGVDGCGVATGFNGGVPSETADSVDADADGFVVAAVGPGPDQAPCPENNLAHELGHVLAAGHEISGLGAAGGYWKPYSHAWSCGTDAAGEPQVTIMNGGSDPTQATATLFSSPAVSRGGEACGQEGTEGLESTQADNARAIRQAAPYVAAYDRRPR